MNTKREGMSYRKVTRFYFRAHSPFFIRFLDMSTIECE